MAAKVLNIEIGKRVIKVCVSEKKGKSYSVSDKFILATPEGSVLDGQVISEIQLGDRLREELNDRNINVKDVYFSVASSKIASREVTLPAAKDEQIKSIVATNVADYFPVDVTKYAIDSVILERTEDECRVLVVAMPSVIVSSYLSLAEYCGFTVRSVDFAVNSQYQILKGINSVGEDMPDMFVTIDPDSASVIFAENGNMLLQRSLSVGGDEMIVTYLNEKDMETEEYMDALEQLNADYEGEQYNISADFSDSMGKLVNGVSRSLDFFRGKVADKAVGRVVLMGSCSHIIGLKESIADELGIETIWLEDVPDLQGLANSIGDISVYIGCLGSRIAPLSFLPAEYVAKYGGGKQKIISDKNFGYFLFGIMAFIALVLAIMSVGSYFANKSKLKKIESEISQLQYAEDEFNAYVRYTQGDAALQTFVDSSVDNNNNLKAFFEELEAKMPSSIVLLNASCNQSAVSMNVTMGSYEEAAMALRQLRTFESIDVITCSAISESEGGLVSFSLSCTYAEPEPETQPVVEESTEAAQ